MRKNRLATLAALLLNLSAAGAAGPEPSLATFAGGCFWCMEADFEKAPGVLSVVSGYTGGSVKTPDYEAVSAGRTGHAESVEIRFDPAKTSYAELLKVFWRNIDPTAKDRQFCDSGAQYRSAIFYHDAEQRRLAEAGKTELEKSGRFKGPIYTEIAAAGPFYPAEDYHQDYYKKNPLRYNGYRWSCGRDRRLQELWGQQP
ncbi:MAG: peptide-methionine (S)-S-oxide reductase MsrA [Nevskiales bacterium]|nr:peptide-methionine (S)-S-oxide reductase MsrA [Nevskiales bacterium]